MNKKLLFGALCSLAIVGCAKTEDVHVVKASDAIGFNTSINAITRGESSVTTINNLTSFNVAMYKDLASAPINGAKHTVSSSDQGSTWTTADGEVLLWSSLGAPATNGTFFATSLNLPGDTKAASETDKPHYTFEANTQKLEKVYAERNLAESKDVVVAVAKTNKQTSGTSGVSLNFKHIFSQIEVQAKNEQPDKYDVKVLGVAIKNIKNGASTFTFPTTATEESKDLEASAWTVEGNAEVVFGNVKKDAGDALTLANSYQRIMQSDNNFFVLPQDLTAWSDFSTNTGTYLSVICQITDKRGASEIQTFPLTNGTDDNHGKFGGAAVPISTSSWLPGMKYIYKLNFFHKGNGTDSDKDGGAGRVDPNPGHNGNDTGNGGGDPGTNTDNKGNNNNISPNPGNGGKNPGDSIIDEGDIIKFAPIVNPWKDATEIEINM